MASLTLSLSDDTLRFVGERAAATRSASAEAYVLALIEAERGRTGATPDDAAERARVEAQLLEGLEGEPIPVTPQYWERKRQALLGRLGEAP